MKLIDLNEIISAFLFLIKNLPGLSKSIFYLVYYHKEIDKGTISLNTEYIDWIDDEGKLHREDGPARVCYFDNIRSYYYHGKKINAKNNTDFKKQIRMRAFW